MVCYKELADVTGSYMLAVKAIVTEANWFYGGRVPPPRYSNDGVNVKALYSDGYLLRFKIQAILYGLSRIKKTKMGMN